MTMTKHTDNDNDTQFCAFLPFKKLIWPGCGMQQIILTFKKTWLHQPKDNNKDDDNEKDTDNDEGN